MSSFTTEDTEVTEEFEWLLQPALLIKCQGFRG